jgi:hypothetical protein
VCVLDIFEIGSLKLFFWADLNHNPPDPCFLSRYDYRYEPLVVG